MWEVVVTMRLMHCLPPGMQGLSPNIPALIIAKKLKHESKRNNKTGPNYDTNTKFYLT